MAPSDRRLLLIGALTLMALAGARLLVEPGLLGYAGGEVYGHAWVQGWHADALPDWPGGTDLALGAAVWPVIDPLPTALAAIAGRILGAVAGYNLWILASVGLAFLGGAVLARREGGDPLVGGLALALAPSLAGSLSSGLTEDGALGLAALGLGLTGDRDPRRGALGGLCLGLLAACGLVLAWCAALVALGFGVAAIVQERARWRSVLAGGLVAVLVALPVALSQGARLLGSGHRAGTPPELYEPLWRLNPWRGVDLVSLLAPGPQDPAGALVRMHPGYLGLAALGLALFAGRSRWWPVLVGAALVAPGARLMALGQPLGLDNPFAAALHLLPGGELLNHHGRLLLLGAIALSVLAARGAARLGPRLGPYRPALAALVALDLLLLSPLSLPLPVADARPPDVATQLHTLTPGPLLVVPVMGPGVHPQRALFDQRAHGRPLLRSPNRPGLPATLERTATGRWLAGLAFEADAVPPVTLSLPGVAVLLVEAPYVAAVEAALGPPDLRGEDGAAWDLAATPSSPAPATIAPPHAAP